MCVEGHLVTTVILCLTSHTHSALSPSALCVFLYHLLSVLHLSGLLSTAISSLSTYSALLRFDMSKYDEQTGKPSAPVGAEQAWMTERKRDKEDRLRGTERDHLQNVQIEMGVSSTKTWRQIKVNSFPGRDRERERSLRGYLVNGACQLTLCRNPLIPQNFN